MRGSFAFTSRVQAVAALVLAAGYFSYVFQIPGGAFRHYGVGDWGDPYFINFLLEHWYTSAARLTDPASPPMYFPVKGTLGYSHGLILYAPAYIAARSVLDPLLAHNVTLLVVLISGSFCLYLLLRHFAGLRFVEALLLTAFFCSSRNLINHETSIWSQTASVFLIPPILVIACAAARMRDGIGRRLLAGLAGLLATLLFTQEFYTAHFALFFAAAAMSAWLIVGNNRAVRAWFADRWSQERRVGVRAAAVVAAAAGAWALVLLISGGGTIRLGGIQMSSRGWERPAIVALIAASVVVLRRGLPRFEFPFRGGRSWLLPAGLGALLGSGVFIWVYLPSILQHAGYAGDEVRLVARSASLPIGLDFVRGLSVYESPRPFYLACLVFALAGLTWTRRDRALLVYSGALVALSFIVLVVPVRFDSFSVWTEFFRPWPGFSAIRDPKRIIHVYELFLVLVAALLMVRSPGASRFRLFASIAAFVLLVSDWNREVFVFYRSPADYRRWVDAPVDVDPACRSFFIKPASEAYTSRWSYFRTSYSVDAMFVALKYSIPTLNGYSGWNPPQWRMFDPHQGDYREVTAEWIRLRNLTGVCELDIERRTMRP